MAKHPYPSDEELMDIGRLVVLERHYWALHNVHEDYSAPKDVLNKESSCFNKCVWFKLWLDTMDKVRRMAPYAEYEGLEIEYDGGVQNG